MKKTVTRPDGTVTVYEGTPEEIERLEQGARLKPLDAVPGIPVPDLRIDPKRLEKAVNEFRVRCNPDCFVCFPRAYWSVVPPVCCCSPQCVPAYRTSSAWDAGPILTLTEMKCPDCNYLGTSDTYHDCKGGTLPPKC